MGGFDWLCVTAVSSHKRHTPQHQTCFWGTTKIHGLWKVPAATCFSGLQGYELQHTLGMSRPLFSPAHPPTFTQSHWGLTRTKIQGNLLRCDLCDVQVSLAWALAAQRDVLHHANAAAGVFNGSGTTVCNQVLQEVAPWCDGLCAAKFLGVKNGQKEKRGRNINPTAGALFWCAGICSE